MTTQKIEIIKKSIEKQISKGQKSYVILPFGETGLLTKGILNGYFGIEEEFIID